MDNQTTQMVEDKSRDDKIHMIQNVSTICLVPLVDKKKQQVKKKVIERFRVGEFTNRYQIE